MTLFFNLDILEREAANNSEKFISLLNNFYTKKLQTRYGGKITKLVGISYILNPGPLFTQHNIDPTYIVQYIKLAGRRDYTMYKLYGMKSLPLSYFPDLKLSNIRTNPLLETNQKEIKFLYEEKEK